MSGLSLRTDAFRGSGAEGRHKPSAPIVQIDRSMTRGRVKGGKFLLHTNHGVFTVPVNYQHENWLRTFKSRNRTFFQEFDSQLSDCNFGRVTNKLEAGQKVHASVYVMDPPNLVSAEEIIFFMESEGALFVGAQGLAFLYEEIAPHMPLGHWLYSFDKRENLYKKNSSDDKDGEVGHVFVPGIHTDIPRNQSFGIADFDREFGDTILRGVDAFLLVKPVS